MAQLELGPRTLGGWDIARGMDGKIGACVVTVHYSVLVNGEAVTGLSDTCDIWPHLTQGQRNQLENIAARVQEICEVG